MMPLGQALAQEFSESSIEYILKWFKKQFSVFLKPKSFNVNAADAQNTIKISKILIKVFENVPVQSTLFNYQRQLLGTLQREQNLSEELKVKLFYTFTILQMGDIEALPLLYERIKGHPEL